MASKKILIQVDVTTKSAEVQINKVVDNMKKLEDTTVKVNKATKKNSASAGLHNAILMESGRLASDLNYGFTAIIVAFLGRLHPIGIIFASLVIALTYLGAEDAQLFMQIPAAVGFVFQGLVLFYLLGTELLVNFKIVFRKNI